MNGLLANNESESALLTSFMMIGKYFYIDPGHENCGAVAKKCLTSNNFFVPLDISILLPGRHTSLTSSYLSSPE